MRTARFRTTRSASFLGNPAKAAPASILAPSRTAATSTLCRRPMRGNFASFRDPPSEIGAGAGMLSAAIGGNCRSAFARRAMTRGTRRTRISNAKPPTLMMFVRRTLIRSTAVTRARRTSLTRSSTSPGRTRLRAWSRRSDISFCVPTVSKRSLSPATADELVDRGSGIGDRGSGIDAMTHDLTHFPWVLSSQPSTLLPVKAPQRSGSRHPRLPVECHAGTSHPHSKSSFPCPRPGTTRVPSRCPVRPARTPWNVDAERAVDTVLPSRWEQMMSDPRVRIARTSSPSAAVSAQPTREVTSPECPRPRSQTAC